MEAVVGGKLAQQEIEWEDNACACVVMASGGYPKAYPKGIAIKGLDESGQIPGATVYHAGTALKNGQFVTAGGRVLGVTACGATLQEALQKAYDGVHCIYFEGAHFRSDIGHK